MSEEDAKPKKSKIVKKTSNPRRNKRSKAKRSSKAK